MDRFCIDRGTLLDNPRIRTLEQPDMHSYHCLLDVRACTRSGFEILMDPANAGDLYTRTVRLDEDGTDTLIDLGRSFGAKGGCTTCTGDGSERRGFRVTVTGTLQDLGSANEPPLLKLNEVDGQAQGCADVANVTDISDMMIELNIPISSSTGTSSFTRSTYIHGSLMLIAWGWFLPSGALIAKFSKDKNPNWFQLHRMCQMVGLLIGTIGFIYALVMFDSLSQPGFMAYHHAVLGCIVMSIGYFQPINGILRPHLPENEGDKKSQKRIIWEKVHKALGWISLILSAITIGLGTVLLPSNDMAFQIAYVVGIILILAVTLK